MPNGLRNWKYKDVIKFLKNNGFAHDRSASGSHEFWINKKTKAVVNINKTKKSYPIRTLETMIRQSEIDKNKWRGS